MDDKPKLKVYSTPKEPKEIKNFWKCCPLKLDYLPETTCLSGKPKVNMRNGKIQDEPSCAWWINSKEHHYCFWRYVKEKSSPDGAMKELVQSELAQLFGWSNTKTHFMLKQAITELTDALKIHGAMELLEDIDAEELESIIAVDDQIGSFNDSE